MPQPIAHPALLALLGSSNRPQAARIDPDDSWIANAAFAQQVRSGLIQPLVAIPGATFWGEAWPEVRARLSQLSEPATSIQHDILIRMEGDAPDKVGRRCFTIDFEPFAEGFPVRGLHAIAIESTAKFEDRTRLELQLALFNAMRTADGPRDAMTRISALLLDRLNLSHVGFAEALPGGRQVEVAVEVSRDGQRHFTGLWDLASLGLQGEQLCQGKLLILHDTQQISPQDAPLAAVLQKGGARSALTIPRLHRGELTSLLFALDTRPRAWSTRDVALLEDALSRTGELLDRLHAEALAHEASERLRLMEGDGRMGLIDWDLKSGSRFRSAGLEKMLGLSPGEDAEADAITPRVDPRDRAGWIEVFEDALANRDRFSTGFRLVADKRSLRISMDGRILRAVDGTPWRLTAMLRDVTLEQELHDAQTAATDRQRFLTELADRMRVPVDPLGAMAEAARTLAEYFGMERVLFTELDEAGQARHVQDLVDPARPAVDTGIATRNPALWSHMAQGNVLVINDMRLALGGNAAEGALVMVPILKGRRAVAAMEVRDSQPRLWTAEEVGAIEVVAERTGAAADRAHAERAVRESERLLRAIGESSTDLIYAKDRAGQFLYANAATEMVIGSGPLLGKSLVDLGGDPTEAEAINLHDNAVIDSDDSIILEEIFTSPDGRRRIYLSTKAPLRDPDGHIIGIAGVSRDMTELVSLRTTEVLHALILDSATDFAIITKDLNGRVTSWNTGAEMIFGVPAADIVGQAIDRTFSAAAIAAGEPASTRERATREGRAEHEGPVERPDGSIFWASGVTMPMFDHAGAKIGYLVIVRDRTAERRQEEHRRLLVDELNHRVKNTLAIVQGMAHQSFRGTTITTDARLNFEERLSALASAHAILTRESWEAADVVEIIGEMRRTHDPRQQRIHVGGPSARLDPQTSVTLAMMLHELVTNARKYGALSGDEGEVSLTWTLEPQAEGRRLVLHWKESGGPPVSPPARQGFGTRLISRSFPPESGSDAILDFRPDGLAATIRIRLPG